MKKAVDWLVVQEPESRFRRDYVIRMAVIEALSCEEAVRLALARGLVDAHAPEYKKPQAQLFQRDRVYVF